MKKIVCILMLLFPLMALCGFVSEGDNSDGLVFVSTENDKRIYILDTLESTYRICDVVTQGCENVIAREISNGRIEYSDSSLMIGRGLTLPLIVFLYNEEISDGCTEVYLLNCPGSYQTKVNLYGVEYDKFKMELIPSGTDNIESHQLPMEVNALQVEFSGRKTPIVVIDALEIGPEKEQFIENVLLRSNGANDGRRKYNTIVIGAVGTAPAFPCTYYRVDWDSLGVRGFAKTGEYFDHIVYKRDNRAVHTFKYDDYLPPEY